MLEVKIAAVEELEVCNCQADAAAAEKSKIPTVYDSLLNYDSLQMEETTERKEEKDLHTQERLLPLV